MQSQPLFSDIEETRHSAEQLSVKERQAYFTPAWFAEALYERHFYSLTARDVLWEPTCGEGALLGVVPHEIPAFGVEIHAPSAEVARQRTGREVIVGDARTVALPHAPTAIFANPPFRLSIFDGVLSRCHQVLPDGGVAGFLLPTYAFQSSGRVAAYAQQWSIETELVPKDIFHRLSTPLVFAMFRKGAARTLVGLALYGESASIRELHPQTRKALAEGGRGEPGGAWGRVVRETVAQLGGVADLEEIYRAIEPRRPTANPHWRERVRASAAQVLERVRPGRFALPGPRMLAA